MSFTQTDSKAPYDYLQRHYRQPKTDDPVERWLPHPEVARAICGALLASGIGGKNVQDAMQDVFVKALAAFRSGTPVPADLRAMKAYCAAIAKNHAIDTRRKADRRKQDLLAAVDPEEYAPLEYGAERRDLVDARPAAGGARGPVPRGRACRKADRRSSRASPRAAPTRRSPTTWASRPTRSRAGRG